MQVESGLTDGRKYWLVSSWYVRCVLEKFEHGIVFIRTLFRDEVIVSMENLYIYICSYGSKRDGLLICFRSVMVSVMFPYYCLQLRMCAAYAERGSLFLMYLTYSRNLKFRLRFVCPTYALRAMYIFCRVSVLFRGIFLRVHTWYFRRTIYKSMSFLKLFLWTH